MRRLLLTVSLTATAALYAQGPQHPLQKALPPADITTIHDILDQDLAPALVGNGELAPSTHNGVAIGVLIHGQRAVFTYGTAKPDSVFEVGSISKTFTATILAQMVQQGTVELTQPVRELLPAGIVDKPKGREITLLDLSAQHSGLPRMPPNFSPADDDDPYRDYTSNNLYSYLRDRGVAIDGNPPFLYSNLGVGLLGNALANRAHLSYNDLLKKQVTGPLGMQDTAVKLTPEMQARFMQGHHPDHSRASAWDFDALAGCGGVRSTAGDMLIYLNAHLHPEQLPESINATPEGKTLAAAIRETHIPRAHTQGQNEIALNWFFNPQNGTYSHNGATGGYTAYSLFNPTHDFAVIVLMNSGGGDTHFADRLGPHIAQRILGHPAGSMAP